MLGLSLDHYFCYQQQCALDHVAEWQSTQHGHGPINHCPWHILAQSPLLRQDCILRWLRRVLEMASSRRCLIALHTHVAMLKMLWILYFSDKIGSPRWLIGFVKAVHFLSADTLIAEVDEESPIITVSNVQILPPQSNVQRPACPHAASDEMPYAQRQAAGTVWMLIQPKGKIVRSVSQAWQQLLLISDRHGRHPGTHLVHMEMRCSCESKLQHNYMIDSPALDACMMSQAFACYDALGSKCTEGLMICIHRQGFPLVREKCACQ